MAEGNVSRASGRRSAGAAGSLSARRPAQVWRVFSYDGLAIAVTGARKDHLQWLSECLTPAFDVDVDPGAHCRIALVTDTRRHGRMVGLGPHREGGSVDCFLLDSRIASARRWTSDNGGVLVRDEEFDVFYRVTHDGRVVEVVSREDWRWSRVALMRVVREVAMNHSRRTGGLFLHAAAFSDPQGVGVILAGPKCAGKTTLLMHALRSGAFHLVSNDRVLVRASREGVLARGMPTLVGVRAPSLRLLPGLARDLGVQPGMHCLTETESRRARVLGGRPGERDLLLTPAQFASLLQAPQAPDCRVAAMLFPEVADGVKGLVLEPLGPRDTYARLTESLFAVGLPVPRHGVFGAGLNGAAGQRGDPRANFPALLTEVPAYACRLGAGAYDDPEATAEVLRRILR